MRDGGCWGCPGLTRLPCGSDRRLHSARQIMHLAAVSERSVAPWHFILLPRRSDSRALSLQSLQRSSTLLSLVWGRASSHLHRSIEAALALIAGNPPGAASSFRTRL
uniref:Uncharacterized protein n=1 Tax=Bionectria ochroleuca TaxID=29856 RepID=A0A8H7NKL2_BIOOC